MATMSSNDTPPNDRDTDAAAFVHIVGLLFGFVGVTLMYLLTDDGFTKQNAANALNWHVPVSIAAVVVVLIGLGVNELAGVAMALILAGATILLALIATLRAYRGNAWEYPLVPQFVAVKH